MNCPHCYKDIKIWRLLFSNELTCLSCQNRVFWGIHPFVAVLGIIFFMTVGYDFLSVCFAESMAMFAAYILLAILLVSALSFRLRTQPSIFSLFESGNVYRFYLASSFFLATSIIALSAIMYFDMIPSRGALLRIDGKILTNERKGNALHLALLNGGTQTFFLTPEDKMLSKYPSIYDLKPYSRVRLLVDPNPNILNFYRIFQIESNGTVIIPYDFIREIRKLEVKNEIRIYLGGFMIALIVYFISQHFMSKADGVILSASSVRAERFKNVPEWKKLTKRNVITLLCCTGILLAVLVKKPRILDWVLDYGEIVFYLIFLVIILFKRMYSFYVKSFNKEKTH